MSTYCPLPWIFQAVRNNGHLRICCQANVSENRGLLRNADGQIFSAANDSMASARNADLMKEARLNMLSGKWSSACQRCKQEEESGLRSRRGYENDIWAERFGEEWARRNTRPDGSLDVNEVPAVSFDIRLGNKCNLKCRMCGPADSDMWYGDHVAIHGNSFEDTQGNVKIERKNERQWITTDPSYNWYENDFFWKHLESRAAFIEHLHIVGGEPLLIEKHYDTLQFLVDGGFSQNITIEYNTNLTVLPEKALKLWRNFRSVKIGVSLDGFNEVNEYIRFPSSWNVIARNLNRLNSEDGPYELWLSSTIQVLNIYNITDLIKWKLESNLNKFNTSKKLPFITSHVVHNPVHYNIRALPPSVKVKAEAKFSEFKSWFSEWSLTNIEDPKNRIHMQSRLDHLLGSWIKYMNSRDESKHMDTFWRTTEQLDRLRKQNFSEACPELYADLSAFK